MSEQILKASDPTKTVTLRNDEATGTLQIVRGESPEVVVSTVSASGVSGSTVSYTPSGTGAVATTVQAKLRETVSVKDFGAVGDGVTDDTAAIRLALSALSYAGGGRLHFPAGMYKTYTNYDPLFTVPANTEIVGDGAATILQVESGSDTNGNIFTMSGANSAIRGMKINFNCVPLSPDTQVAFSIAASNLAFSDLVMTGSHTALVLSILHCFVLNQNATHEGLTIKDCTIQNFRYGILRASTCTGTQTRVSIQNNLWQNNYANHIALNTPNGVIDDVDVIGNTFGDCPGGDAFSTYAIMLGMASCTNYRIIGNHFKGTCKEAVHLEEAGANIIVTGNTFNGLTKGANTNGGRGIYIVDNNVSGSYAGPSKFIIADNVMSGSSVSNSDIGIYILKNSVKADKYSIDNNILSAFASGITTSISTSVELSGNEITGCTTGITLSDTGTSVESGSSIEDNLIVDCTTGINTNRGWPQIQNNVIRNATTGLQSVRPGMFGYHTFLNVTTPLSSTGEPAEIMGWFYEATGVTIVATPTNTIVDTIKFPDCCQGDFSVLLGSANNNNLRTLRHWNLNITGAGVVTATLNSQRTIGNIATSGTPINNSGKLAVTFTNSGSAITDAYVQVSFDGTYAL